MLALTAPRVNEVNAHGYRKLELDCATLTKTNTALAARAFTPLARSPYTGRRVAPRSVHPVDAWPCDWPRRGQADHGRDEDDRKRICSNVENP
jgi:hypothetical protein